MLRHIATSACGEPLARVDASLKDLRVLIEELAGTIESKKIANVGKPKSKQRPTKGDELKLERLRNQLEDYEEARREFEAGTAKELTHYRICKIRAELNGTSWSPEAKATLDLPRLAHEGRGEKAVRTMRGLELVVTQDKRDMDDGDIKWLDNGHNGLQTVQTGRGGLCAFLNFVWELARSDRAKDLDLKVVEAIKCGELPKELLEGDAMPKWLLEDLVFNVMPSTVLGEYGDIYCAFDFGYVVIPQADADEAWSLVSITKGKPRYALNKRYSVKKMLEESYIPEPIVPVPILMVG